MLNFINLKFKMNMFYIFDRRLLENVPEYENISYRRHAHYIHIIITI